MPSQIVMQLTAMFRLGSRFCWKLGPLATTRCKKTVFKSNFVQLQKVRNAILNFPSNIRTIRRRQRYSRRFGNKLISRRPLSRSGSVRLSRNRIRFRFPLFLFETTGIRNPAIRAFGTTQRWANTFYCTIHPTQVRFYYFSP